jgi:hypothetical protein
MKAQLSHININFDGYTLVGDVDSGSNYIQLDFCSHEASLADDKRDALRVAEALDSRGCEISLDTARRDGWLMFPRAALGTQLDRIVEVMLEVLHADGQGMTLTFEYSGKSYVFGQRRSAWRRDGIWTYYIDNPSIALPAKIQALREVATARLERIERSDAQALDIAPHNDPEVCLAKVVPLLAT